ncbi:uncharacterized protein LOC116303312 [Actinia tenebrosa]|uniref:Uncharacterized protein LOC116303312 n=1 Tax=Actinia tenebrosa TaxID=6105 RepID=A0A6P8IPB8_ACTTE|nr:uncharacterized protein LOC116303312 [Actinia tenebrosa]
MVLKALVAAFCVFALRISSFFGVSDLPMCVEKTTAAPPSTILPNVTSIPMSLPTNISFGPTSIGHKVSDLPTSGENATAISPTVLSPNVTSMPMSLPTNISFSPTGIPFPLPTNGSPSEDFVRRNMMRYFRGSDRTVELFQPKLKKEALTFVKEIKTYTSRSTPSKTFFDAINDIEVGVAQARTAGPRVRYSEKKIKTIKNTITLAVDKRMYQFARQRLGQALFLIDDHNSRRTSRSKRSTAPDTSSFIKDLKRSIGDDKFDKLMAVRGDVTLMFAIDTTGSMSDEIETAKRMAIDVVNYLRENPVNYILAPFSDPETGAVVFEENTNAAGFVKAISNLRASGGGDCPELTMTGILNAIYEGPDPGSPLYVFTDASAKDATDKNIRDVITMAKYEDITINFYTTGSLCGKSIVDNPFLKIAEATSGQVLRLSGSGELGLLKSLTKSGIDESSTITSGSSRTTRRKRSVGSKRYSIWVDDSAKSISISITTDNSNK